MGALALALVATLLPTAAFASPASGLASPAYAAGRYDRKPDYGKHPSRCETTYRVRKGDNLTKIARHYRTSVHALVRANHIRNPNRIYAGQMLCIR
ncbi:MAG: hypothetical protein DCC57_15050 [Chloroflexi bacterium]|nr:MAG: hypothetical protein DCC57_15050 [Chloroflexota bacterium]